jgi:hypothetical protein
MQKYKNGYGACSPAQQTASRDKSWAISSFTSTMAANTATMHNADDHHHDAEKTYGASHVNDTSSSPKLDEEEEEEFTPEEQRKIIHRIDRRLIATTGESQYLPTMTSN